MVHFPFLGSFSLKCFHLQNLLPMNLPTHSTPNQKAPLLICPNEWLFFPHWLHPVVVSQTSYSNMSCTASFLEHLYLLFKACSAFLQILCFLLSSLTSFFLFLNRVLLCSLGWPWTPTPSASASWVLEDRHALPYLILLLILVGLTL